MSAMILSSGGAGALNVVSLNGETGALTIVAGTGITVTPSGTNITITASSAGTIGGSIDTNQVAFGSGTNTITGSSAFTFDGVSLALAATGTIAISNSGAGGTSLTDSGGNGILLLNSATAPGSSGIQIVDDSATGIIIETNGATSNLGIINNGSGLLNIESDSGGISINSSAADITIDASGGGHVLKLQPNGQPVQVHEITYNPFVLLSGSGAVPAHAAQRYIITLASAASLTLVAPTVTTDDGNTVTIISDTAFAHTLTATNLFNSGVSAAVNLATFAAFKGATIVLMAYQGRWDVVSLNGVVMS